MVSRLKGEVVTSAIDGAGVSFFVVNPADVIQKRHYAGHFYEEEELQIIAKYFSTGMVYVDVGANIGNHVVYVATYLSPSAIIAVEPNPAALEMFRINCALNGLSVATTADAVAIGESPSLVRHDPIVQLCEVGLGEGSDRVSLATPENNLGGTSLQRDPQGPIQVMRGDDLLLSTRMNFLKIDVEGMEMRVLEGLGKTIKKWRPIIFIEIDNANAQVFLEWVAGNGYLIRERYKRYAVNENFLIVPCEGQAAESGRSLFARAIQFFRPSRFL